MGRFFGASASDGGGRFFGPNGSPRSRAEVSAIFTTPADIADGEQPYTSKAQTNAKDFAQSIQRLVKAGQFKTAAGLLDQHRGALTPAEQKAYGLDKLPELSSKFGDSSGGGGLGKVVQLGNTATGGLLGKGLEVFDRPSQYTKLALGQLKQGNVGGAAKSLFAISPINPQVAGNLISGSDVESRIRASGLDQGGDGRLDNLREALGIDKNSGGRLAGAFDFVGSAAIDPTSYIGGAGGAKAAVKGVTEQIAKEAGTEVAETIARKISVEGLERGVKKGIISEAEHEAVKTAARRMAEDMVNNPSLRPSLLRPISSRRLINSIATEGAEAAAEGVAEKTLTQISRAGRSGIRVGMGEAKFTVLPTHPFGKSLPGFNKFAFQEGRAAGSALDDALRAVDDAPASDAIDATNIKMTTTAAERTLPKEAGVQAADTPVGRIIGLRDGDGKLVSYATVEGIEDGAPRINLLHTVEGEGGKGYAQQVLKAVEDSGLSVEDIARNSEFTDEGRSAFKRYLTTKYGAEGAEQAAQAAGGDITRRGLFTSLRESAVGTTLREAFVPRAQLRDAYGQQVADILYEAQGRAAATVGHQTNSIALQLHTAGDAARALKSGVGENLAAAVPEAADLTGRKAWEEIANAAITAPERFDGIVQAAAADGAEDVGKALNAVQSVIKQADDATERAGATATTAVPGQFFNPDAERPTMPRIVTREGADLARDQANVGLRNILGIDPAQVREGANLTNAIKDVSPQRTLVDAAGKVTDEAIPGARYADMSVKEINADIAKRLNLPEDTKFFVDDPVASVALRSRTAFEAAAQTEMLTGLEKVMVDKDTPLIKIVREGEDAAIPAGWKKLEGMKPVVGDVYAPPEIANELRKINDIIVNDASLQKLAKVLTDWNGVWASYATSPIVTGFGFHSRNSIGNVILNFLAGLQDPRFYVSAIGHERRLQAVQKLMRTEGIAWEDALAQAVKKPADRAFLQAAVDHGIVNSGIFADISHSNMDRLVGARTRGERARQILGDNAIIRSGRSIGNVVENNARLAHFEWAMGKYGVNGAERSVKKYLFDYADLTPFERNKMKSINRFYTFQRKNLGVQLAALAQDPWRVAMTLRAEGNLYNRDKTENAALPDYARKEGFGIAGFLGIPKGTEGVALNIDTPLDAAMNTIDPIAQAVTMMPGIRNLVPPEYRSNAQELTRSVLNQRAGGPNELVNFLYEKATGKDLFSGKDITDENADQTLTRLANVFVPLYGKVRTTMQQDRNPGNNARLALMQSIVGLQTLPISDKQRNQVAYVGAQEAQNALSKLKAQGVDVPTYTELQRIGLVPDLSTKKAATPKRSSAQVDRDTVAKINAARNAAGASPLTGQPRSSGSSSNRRFFG